MHEGEDDSLSVDVFEDTVSLDEEVSKKGGKEHTDTVMIGVDVHDFVGLIEILFDDFDSGVYRH